MKSFFSHDCNARNDDKIIRVRMKHGAAGYGVYFMLLERLRESKGYMSVKDYNMIGFDLRVDASMIKSVVEDFGLFEFSEDGKFFYSESFTNRMTMMDELSNVRSEAGKLGAQKRWQKNDTDNQEVIANEWQTDGKAIANAKKNDSNKIKLNKIKTLNPPPQTPPPFESESEASEGPAGGGYFCFMVNSMAEARLKEVLKGLDGMLDKDWSESLRLCSGYDSDSMTKALNHIILWRSRMKPADKFYEELQALQKMEKQKKISPPPREEWDIYQYLKRTLTDSDVRTVLGMVDSRTRLDALRESIEVVKTSKTIKMPFKYLTASLEKA